MELRAIKPGVWTATGTGLEVFCTSDGAQTIGIFPDGRVMLESVGPWEVRPARPVTAKPVHAPSSRDLFEQPGKLGPLKLEHGTYGPPFSANFEGICPECNDEIETGDTIRMSDDGAVHAECASYAQQSNNRDDATDGGHTSYADGIPS